MNARASAGRKGALLKSPSRRTSTAAALAGPVAGWDDEALLTSISHGRRDAFAALYDRYSDRAYRVARSLCDDQPGAEIAVRDAFVSVWRGRAYTSARPGRFAAWLLATVRERTASRAGEHQQTSSEADAGGSGIPPAELRLRAKGRNEAGLGNARLRALPDSQIDVIVLACYGELTVEEIADQLDLAPAEVKMRMRLGLLSLRAQSKHSDGAPWRSRRELPSSAS